MLRIDPMGHANTPLSYDHKPLLSAFLKCTRNDSSIRNTESKTDFVSVPSPLTQK